jgi:hypothetical protein
MNQIHLKFQFHVLEKLKPWWNLASRSLITSSCQLTLYPRDLWFTVQESWIDLKIEFEFI